MARTCESCGRYLGARTDCVCGWSGPSQIAEPAISDVPVSPVDAEPSPGSGPVVAPPFWAGVRGVVVDGRSIRARSAGGVVLGRLLVLAAIVTVVILNWQPIVDMMTDALLAFLLANLIPIIIVVVIAALLARFLPGVGGCLLMPLHLLTLGAFSARERGQKADDGWDLVLETARGNVAVRIAADIPVEGSDEIVVHGPAYGGRKHAWLVQGVEPTFTRLGRGIVPLAVATILVVIGLVLLMVQVRAGQ